MNKKLLLISVSLILISCSIKTVSEFYILSYIPGPESLNRFNLSSLPIDAKVEVQNFDMNRVYDRNSIVVRKSLHKLGYDDKNKWALRPDRAVPELITYHINAAGIFKECKSDFISVIPDYYISGTINNIEIYRNGENVFAHIDIVMELRDKNRNILVIHRISEKKDISSYDVSFFIKTVSDILKEGTHEFIVKIVDHFMEQNN